MLFAFKSASPLNTKLIGPDDGTAPLYIVRTPLLHVPWVTAITRCEGGTIRRFCDIIWSVRHPRVRIGTNELPLDDFLAKIPGSSWAENHRMFSAGGRKFRWLDSLRPYARVELVDANTGTPVAYLNHGFFSKTTLSIEAADVEPQVLDMVVVTAVIMERWREVRR
ncbi:hypothetical protein AURDEDRAFT_168351 [Auricularia subglabra TFB-10046 SS5]|nr:hypothetical protein AURDEDRAFT_168351 [Auricularia subglabra TFB-10046 SS5]